MMYLSFQNQDFDLPTGTIRATVLIETIRAAFQMDEILYELKEHSAGLNCGRWDYIFSYIKKQSKGQEPLCQIEIGWYDTTFYAVLFSTF